MHSAAIASKCSTVLVDAPSAMSSASALVNARFVSIMRGVIASRTRLQIAAPARLASRMRSLDTASTVPLPGSAMPSASHRQLSEFAVYMPQQLPQPGQATFSSVDSSSMLISPFLTAPIPSYTDEKLTFLPFHLPLSIGPPDTNTDGILTRAAPMSMPGTILSQLGTNTAPSNACAYSMVSTLSAMSSREGREYRMPA